MLDNTLKIGKLQLIAHFFNEKENGGFWEEPKSTQK